MPRPLRVEFENAHYHVMHRAVAGRSIFLSPQCYQSFLDILGQACFRYGLEIHAYCLIHNQYHLLIKTPKGNLSRIMRHINGVYTQRYNAFHQMDGPLFKGRFKAVLVEGSDILLKLSSYIHRRPASIKKPVAKQLNDYRWSSYQAYTGQVKPAHWLVQSRLFSLLEKQSGMQCYTDCMTSNVDEEIIQLYSKKRLPSVIGSKAFKTSLPCQATISNSCSQTDITSTQIIRYIADFYCVAESEITQVHRGPQQTNFKRKMAMYLCQELGGLKLNEIAPLFHLTKIGAISHATWQVRQWIKKDSEFKRTIDLLIEYIQELNA